MSDNKNAFILLDVAVLPKSGLRAALKKCARTGVLYVAIQVLTPEDWQDCFPPVALKDLRTAARRTRLFLEQLERAWLPPGKPEPLLTNSAVASNFASFLTGAASALITVLIT